MCMEYWYGMHHIASSLTCCCAFPGLSNISMALKSESRGNRAGAACFPAWLPSPLLQNILDAASSLQSCHVHIKLS